MFYDRAAGDTVYGMIEQPPTLQQPNLFYGRLQDINDRQRHRTRRRRSAAFDFDGKIPTVYSYNVGVQKSLPWTMRPRRRRSSGRRAATSTRRST